MRTEAILRILLVTLAILPVAILRIALALPPGQIGQSAEHHRIKRFFKAPMPWEAEYFDPTYHVWPKGKSSKDDKKA